MKKLMLILSCTLLLFVAGCKNPNQPEQTQSLSGSVSRPSWTINDDYDYSSSMTAIVKVDLRQTYPDAVDHNGNAIIGELVSDKDLLAAFQGDICVGVVSPEDELFYLYITGVETVEYSEYSLSSITLRYYCAKLNNLFEATNAFSFQNDAMLGTVADPLMPEFYVIDK